jgi:hypothetical protein
MGFDFFIGNATPRKPDLGDAPGGSFGWEVGQTNIDEAPAFPNDAPWSLHGNQRSPGYGVWADFAKEVGLAHLFNHDHRDEDGHLLRQHPGIAPLYPYHVEEIRKARDSYRLEHPEATPRFCASQPNSFDAIDEPHSGENAQLARLEWLLWWCEWAVKNCEHPAFMNH